MTATAPPRGAALVPLRGLRQPALPQTAAPQPGRLPRVRRARPTRRAGTAAPTRRPGIVAPPVRPAAGGGPDRLRRRAAVPAPAHRRAGQHRPGRGGRLRHGHHRRAPGRPGRDGLPLPRRQPGLRGGRADHPGRRAGAGRPHPARPGHRLRRGADAGGRAVVDADGHRQPGHRRAAGGGSAHRERPHRPDLRRGGRLVRHQHRPGARRERRADGLRRPPGDPPGHRSGLPEGFQTADFLLRHGQVDMVVQRRSLRGRLVALLAATRAGRAAGRRPPVPRQEPASRRERVADDDAALARPAGPAAAVAPHPRGARPGGTRRLGHRPDGAAPRPTDHTGLPRLGLRRVRGAARRPRSAGTARPSWAGWPGWPAGTSWSSATRRGTPPPNWSPATSAWPARPGTARRCG